MISASDFTTFSKFAERLDAEVSEVREEALLPRAFSHLSRIYIYIYIYIYIL